MNRIQRGFIVGTLWVGLAAGVGGAVAGAYGTRLFYLHKIDQMIADARAEADKASEQNRLASNAYELQRAKRQVRVATTTRKVDHELEVHHDWAAVPVPDSLRQSLDQAAIDIGAAEPGAALPRVPGVADREQQRPDPELPGGAGVGAGLPREAQRSGPGE